MIRIFLFKCALVCTLIGAGEARAQLVGYWNFDDATANDSSGLNNHGAFQNGATTSANVATALGGGLSLQLGGLTQHVLVPHHASLNLTSGGTISAWVNTSNVGWGAILAKSPSAGSSAAHPGNYELRIENSTRVPTLLYERTSVAGSDAVAIAGTSAVPTNTWTHIATTFDGTTTRFYMNGNLVNSAAMAAGFGEVNTNPLYIGTRADFFTTMNGLLDEVAVFNAPLHAIQFKALAAGSATPDALLQQITPVTATASSFLGPPTSFNRPPSATVDGVGQTTTTPDVAAPGTGMWLSSGTGVANSPNDTDPQITFDLGSVKNLDGMTIYNYNEPARLGRGVDLFELLLSNDNFVNDIRSGGIFDLAAAPGNATNPGQSFLLDDIAQYVRFDIISNINGSNFATGALNGVDNNFVGLNEVEFFGTQYVPEPATAATWVVLGIGTAAAGWRFRRRPGR